MELVYNSRLWDVVGGSGHASDSRQAFEGPLLIEVKNWLVYCDSIALLIARNTQKKI